MWYRCVECNTIYYIDELDSTEGEFYKSNGIILYKGEICSCPNCSCTKFEIAIGIEDEEDY